MVPIKGLNINSGTSVSGLARSSVVLPEDAIVILTPWERITQRFTKENPLDGLNNLNLCIFVMVYAPIIRKLML